MLEDETKNYSIEILIKDETENKVIRTLLYDLEELEFGADLDEDVQLAINEYEEERN